MSARAEIAAHFTSDTLANQLLDAHRAEVIAEHEAYPGELAMLRGVVGVLRTVVRVADLADCEGVRELRRLVAEHYADERAAYADAEEKTTTVSTTAGAAVTPDFFQPGRTYTEPDGLTDWQFRCDSITTHPENSERTALGWRHFRGAWEPYAYHEDDWGVHQVADHYAAEQVAITPDAVRLALLRTAASDYQGALTTRIVQRLYVARYGPGDWRSQARRDLAHGVGAGWLTQDDTQPGLRRFWVNARRDGA